MATRIVAPGGAPSHSQNTVGAPGAPFATFDRNSPGTVVFLTRHDLQRYVVERVSLLSSLTALMPYLAHPGATAPDSSFVAELASSINDMAYQLQLATRLLFEEGGAA